ncbi:DUF3575 domain-containing protein [Elizabethkingia anophelis]|uniref:DUF3575 domain-containing protein n=1 Tax=Elizabethkingia anophelis TaxID=1117645 RepID=UPI0021A63208|nr:hypothetical protein [Elizabethkingia anophelis]
MLVLSKIAYSQENKHQIKGNVLFAPIGVFNIGYEYIFNHHWTGQTDLFISIWRFIFRKTITVGYGHIWESVIIPRGTGKMIYRG